MPFAGNWGSLEINRLGDFLYSIRSAGGVFSGKDWEQFRFSWNQFVDNPSSGNLYGYRNAGTLQHALPDADSLFAKHTHPTHTIHPNPDFYAHP